MKSLTVSIVSYLPDRVRLRETLQSLHRAVALAKEVGALGEASCFLVDNGPDRDSYGTLMGLIEEVRRCPQAIPVEVVTGQGNIGFGKGHNIAIERSRADVHLVLNPDVLMAEDSLVAGLRFLQDHSDVGLLTPLATYPDGSAQYLCKRYPSVLDLALRGFAPVAVRMLFDTRLAEYEMRNETASHVVFDVPIVSGCFMLCRLEALRTVGGFCERFFLYFEDFDLSLRLRRVTRSAFVPKMRIVHHGGGASRKGWAHIRMFVGSAITFFQLHGWRWW